MCEIHVRGCQFAAAKVVKAQETPSFDRPPRT